MSSISTLIFLIRRFVWSSHESSIKAMVLICFISITLGSFALTLVMGIMNGFEHETRVVIQGIHPDLVITGDGKTLAYDKIKHVLKEEFKNSIAGSAPHAQAHALVTTNKAIRDNSTSVGSLAVLLGMDPLDEPTVSSLHTMIVACDTPPTTIQDSSILSKLLKDNQVIIGTSLARTLDVTVGDTLTLLFAPEESEQESSNNLSDNLTLEKQKVIIAGIFKTGIDDIDSRVIGLSNNFLTSFYPGTGITQIGIKLSNKSLEETTVKQLEKRLGLTILSWHELYPALLAALTLEKYTMFLIVALITLVASMNIVSLLYMYITNKQAEIAVARTLGITKQELIGVFVGIGATLSLSAAVLGAFLAFIAGYILKYYIPIPLPDIYYVSHVPVHLTWTIIATVITLAVVVSILASSIPARRINAISLAAILRNAR